MKKEKMALLVQLDLVERRVHQARWVFQDRRALVGTPFQEKLGVQDRKEIPVMLDYLDRKVHLDQLVLSALWELLV